MCSVRQGLPLKTQGWDAAGFRQGSLSRKQRTAKKHIYKAGWENCSGFHLIPFRAFLNYCLLFTKKVQVWCYSPYTQMLGFVFIRPKPVKYKGKSKRTGGGDCAWMSPRTSVLSPQCCTYFSYFHTLQNDFCSRKMELMFFFLLETIFSVLW